MGYIVAILVAVLVAGGGVWRAKSVGEKAGYERATLECKAEISEMRRQATAEREKGRIIADRLATQLADTKDRLDATEKGLRREINRRASAVRAALDGELVRMLNESSVIRERVEPASPAGTAAAGTAAPPTDAATTDRDRLAASGAASERSVATWIAAARTSYAACVAQLHALQDYVRSVTR